MQRFERISGLTLANSSGAKRIVMSAADTAIARVPYLVHDMDVSRLAAAGGRCRASGAVVTKVGAGVSLVASSLVGGKPAYRTNETDGTKVTISRAWSPADFTLVMIGTLAAATRTPSSIKHLLAVANSAGDAQVSWRMLPGSGLSIALLGSGGVVAPPESLPAADTPAIFHAQRSGTQLSVGINGAVIATGTDSDATEDISASTLHLFTSSASGTLPQWHGDCARLLVYDAPVVDLYPGAWSAMIDAAKAEYSIS